MNAWDGLNIYTGNYTQWAGFMNLTTKEWNLGPFPSNVVAVPGSFEDGKWGYPDNSIVVEKTSRAKLATRDIEKIMFGVASGVVILLMAFWVFWRRKAIRNRFRELRGKKPDDPAREPMMSGNSGSSVTAVEDVNGISDRDFREQLALYYDNVTTMPELAEKELEIEAVGAEDIQAANDLLRKMFEIDFKIFSMSSNRGVSTEEVNSLRTQRTDILAEVKRLVDNWGNSPRGVTTWDQDEAKLLKSIGRSLGGDQPRRQVT